MIRKCAPELSGHPRENVFGWGMTTTRPLPEDREILLRTVKVERLDSPEARARAQALLAQQHYLGAVQAVGEQMHYAVTDAQGEWVAVLVFAAAALHLRPRDEWIGWTNEQRRRRLALVANAANRAKASFSRLTSFAARYHA